MWNNLWNYSDLNASMVFIVSRLLCSEIKMNLVCVFSSRIVYSFRILLTRKMMFKCSSTSTDWLARQLRMQMQARTNYDDILFVARSKLNLCILRWKMPNVIVWMKCMLKIICLSRTRQMCIFNEQYCTQPSTRIQLKLRIIRTAQRKKRKIFYLFFTIKIFKRNSIESNLRKSK